MFIGIFVLIDSAIDVYIFDKYNYVVMRDTVYIECANLCIVTHNVYFSYFQYL